MLPVVIISNSCLSYTRVVPCAWPGACVLCRACVPRTILKLSVRIRTHERRQAKLAGRIAEDRELIADMTAAAAAAAEEQRAAEAERDKCVGAQASKLALA